METCSMLTVISSARKKKGNGKKKGKKMKADAGKLRGSEYLLGTGVYGF